ncbi:ATP-binding protein [Kitasatospora sp. NBC_00240]|uniref:ATP-binding protein n=1 Tax=Kitasatospora sp. NBC_00240 TaxID=2903567 RepID=UPI002252FF30|nr:ATP-binding protein [Kitasatospora sp. NBC_00240]MCX5208532.1 ATP-binding protein [Kitasatospora sp. NBC_00240]
MTGKHHSIRATGWARKLPIGSGVRAGRQWARRHLDELGWTSTAPETADAVVLIVSELVTNAHVHAGSSADLVLTWDGTCLYVSVHDSSSEAPRPREADADAVSGRGMALVDALADDWQTRTGERGKTVTACFHPPGRPGHRHPEITETGS